MNPNCDVSPVVSQPVSLVHFQNNCEITSQDNCEVIVQPSRATTELSHISEANIQQNYAATWIFNPTTIILIITGILALLGLGFVIAAILISESKLKNKNTNTSTRTRATILATNIEYPYHERQSSKSMSLSSLSDMEPPFKYIEHVVEKSNKARTLKDIVSPNHWLGNTLYDPDTIFNVYPYYGKIENNAFMFSWPTNGFVTENSLDLTYESIPMESYIRVSSLDERVISCDIVDIDALVGTVIWQYHNIHNKIGSMTIPLAKGSPFITIEANNIGLSLECGFDFTHQNEYKLNKRSSIHIFNISEDSGYILVLSKNITITVINDIIYIPRFTGVARIAYFDSTDMMNILIDHHAVYPIESTLSTYVIEDTTMAPTSFMVDTTFQWTTRNMYNNDSDDLLMISLPHHNITNIIYHGSPIFHPLIGPFRFIIAKDNKWVLAEGVVDYKFPYSIKNDSNITDIEALRTVWKTESSMVISSPPTGFVNWCKWMGSVATLLLIGNMLNEHINDIAKILESNLLLITKKNRISRLVYDDTWGGIIDDTGINNRMGNSDNGNAFYESHIGQFGYLVFAYAVAGYFNQDFISQNKDTALLFVRDIANPYEYDDDFPLWRNKDWYFGYSIASGLSPNQTKGKYTSNIGENIFGYYGCYLLSLVLDQSNTDPQIKELHDWSLTLLAHEISSLQYNFQVSSQNMVTIDSEFRQNTVVNRGDTYYGYNVENGNAYYPERHASMMVPIMKPISPISLDYIDNVWAKSIEVWLNDAVQSSEIEPESLGYALALLSICNNKDNNVINRIMDNKNIYLPYGSTWSSILYWILNQ